MNEEINDITLSLIYEGSDHETHTFNIGKLIAEPDPTLVNRALDDLADSGVFSTADGVNPYQIAKSAQVTKVTTTVVVKR